MMYIVWYTVMTVVTSLSALAGGLVAQKWGICSLQYLLTAILSFVLGSVVTMAIWHWLWV